MHELENTSLDAPDQEQEPMLADTCPRPPLGDTRPPPSERALKPVVKSMVFNRLFGARFERPKIGRFSLLECVGSGAMGIVYAAHDAQLDRRVAVKVLRRRGDVFADPEARARLLREAQAMAHVSHPNIVTVFEAGEVEGQVFIAMEYVTGRTLEDWSRSGDPDAPSWRELLRAYIDAGRGLAAAHAASVVHRDFKPSNVLVGEDGAVKVVDFGLARTARVADSTLEKTAAAVGGEGGPHAPSLTRTGAIMGTPAYMSPEQFRGEIADARSDQFAFCVALYEALWRGSPFTGDTLAERRASLLRGVPQTPPRSRVPRVLWSIIGRGLAQDPALRWPDMDALLRALTRVQHRRARWVSAGSLALVAGAGLGLGSLLWGRADVPPEPCAAVERELEDVWGHGVARAVTSVFRASGEPFADDAIERVRARLDAWAKRWKHERRAVCETARDGGSSEQGVALREACLDELKTEFKALVEQLAQADGEAVVRSVDAVAELPAVSVCADESALLLGMRAPEPDEASQVAALRGQLVRARALQHLGNFTGARELIAGVSEVSLDYAPVRAELLFERASLEIASGSHAAGLELLEQTVDAAERSRHDRVAARAWRSLAEQSATVLRDRERAANALRRADAAWARVGGEPNAQARLDFVRGVLAKLDGELDAAERHLLRALDELSAGVNPARPAVVDQLATVVGAAGRLDDAVELRRQALVAAEELRGPLHPETAGYINNLGTALFERANPEDGDAAEDLFTRAVAIWTHGHTAPHLDLGIASLNLAILALQRGRLDAARRDAGSAAETFSAVLSPEHPLHATVEDTLGSIALLSGDAALALAHYERARDHLRDAGYGADDLAPFEVNRGLCLLALGRLPEADAALSAALVGAPPRSSAAHHVAASLGRVELLLRTGKTGDAAAALEALPAELSGMTEHDAALLRAIAARRLQRDDVDCESVARHLAAIRASEPPEPTASVFSRYLEQLDLSEAERACVGGG